MTKIRLNVSFSSLTDVNYFQEKVTPKVTNCLTKCSKTDLQQKHKQLEVLFTSWSFKEIVQAIPLSEHICTA